MNFTQARINMITQQIRAWGVTDERILNLYKILPREDFVSQQYRELAFADTTLPVGGGEFTMPPKEEARTLQALKLSNKDKVLEIGVESGYIAAMLAKLSKQVVVIDQYDELIHHAQEKLIKFDITNVNWMNAGLINGWETEGPFNVIVITGSLPYLPLKLQENLAKGGRIFGIIGDPPVMEATLIESTQQGWRSEKLFETNRPRLSMAIPTEKFVF